MLMQEERELVVEYGKKMSAARLSTGTSGNQIPPGMVLIPFEVCSG